MAEEITVAGETAAATEATTATTTSATTEAADPSIRDSLEKAFDESEKAEGEKDPVSEAARTLRNARQPKEGATTTTVEDPAKAAADAKVKREAELAAMSPEDRAKAQAEDARKADEAAQIEAPTSWSAADREMFAKQTPEAKKWLLARHKAMETDYHKKTGELAGTRRLAEEMNEIFKDYSEEMGLKGITHAQAVRQLVAAHTKLRNTPSEGIKYLADQYGIDLKGLVEGAAAADPAGESPTVVALRKEVAALTGQIQSITGQQSEQQQHARLSEVTQFADEKDEQGQLKRPYFEEVAEDITALLKTKRADTLQTAYDMAIYANPQTRAKVLAAQDAQRRAKEDADRKAKADAARKASFDVKGEGAAAPVVAQKDSIRASLEAAYDAHEGRV